jgi:beta-galactosidase
MSSPFAILEQQSGPGGQLQYLHATSRPGQMRLWAWQSIAHGAKLLSFFRWRTCPYGSEQHWHGLLDADNRDNRRLAEAAQLGRELRKLPCEFFDAPVARSAAVLRDYDNDTNDKRINTYTRAGAGEGGRWLAELGRRHVPADQVWPSSSWDGYRLLIAPHLKIVDKPLVAKLEAFVRAGGTLVLGAQSGSKDRNCHIVEKPLPGLLRKLAGVEVQDWTTLGDGAAREAAIAGGPIIAMNTFVERLRPRGAKPVAMWTTDDPLLAGAPAITVNRLGRGLVYYVGGYCPAGTIAVLVGHLACEHALRPPVVATDDVEIVHRATDKRSWLVLLNHSASVQRARQVPEGMNLLTGRRVNADLSLDSYGVAVIELGRR